MSVDNSVLDYRIANPMELIHIPSQEAYYNLACLLKLQYKPGKQEILEGEIIMLEGDRRFDDRKRPGNFRSTSQLHITFTNEPVDVLHLIAAEADEVYEKIVNRPRSTKRAKETAH